MKRLKSLPERTNYANFPTFEHVKVEKDGAIVEQVKQLTPEEILKKANNPAPLEPSDNSGILYPSSLYMDDFATIDALNRSIDKLTPDNIKKK